MKKAWMVCLFLMVAVSASGAEAPDSTSLTRVGQEAPGFSVKMLDGEKFSLESVRGSVVLINFFATWCPPCMAEMPRMETEIHRIFEAEGLVVIAVGREHTMEEIEKFREEKGFTFALAPDPERHIYGKYATMYIPRNVLIDREGRIVYQSKGYTEEEFETLLKAVRQALE